MRWEKVLLGDVFVFQEGPGVRKWQFTDSGIKLLNVANIHKSGYLDLDKTERHLSVEEVEQRYKHFFLEAGDMVIASSGISIDTDGFLRTRGAFVDESHLPLCLNTSTIRFRPNNTADISYLKHWIDSIDFREQITRLVTGSAQKNFGPSHLKQIKIPLPPLSEQKRLAAILDRADELRRVRRKVLLTWMNSRKAFSSNSSAIPRRIRKDGMLCGWEIGQQNFLTDLSALILSPHIM